MKVDRTDSTDSLATNVSHTNTSKLKFYQKPGLVFSYINLANLMQYMHMQFMGASMLGLEKDMGYSPKKISILIVAEQVSFLTLMPIWGLLCDLFELKFVLIVSIACSGFLVMILGFVRVFFLMVILRIMNGIMIGSGIPAGQKYVVIANMKDTGYAFGIMHGVCGLGRLTCSVIVSHFSPNKYFDVYGWRFCSFFLGIACIASLPLLFLIPKFKSKNRRSLYDIIDLNENNDACSVISAIWQRFLAIASIKTVLLLTLLTFFAQGFYTSATVLTIYFQYCRMSNLRAGITVAVVIIGGMTGGLLGGIATDFLNKKFPKYGRISVGVACTLLRFIPLNWILFFITFDNMLEHYTMLVICLFGIGITSASISFVDRSLFFDVVMPYEQSFGIGIMLTVCGATSVAVFPPILGFLLKDVFGYQESVVEIESMPYHMIRNNAFALRNGIACLSMFSTFSTLLFYIATFSTYYKDSKAIQEQLESETSLTEVEVVPKLVYKRTISRLDSK